MNLQLQNNPEVFGDVPNNTDPALFAQGQKDCKEGIEPQGKHPSYISGYGFQYEMEQVQGHRGFN